MMYFMKTKTKNSANIFRELIREARGGEVMVNMEQRQAIWKAKGKLTKKIIANADTIT